MECLSVLLFVVLSCACSRISSVNDVKPKVLNGSAGSGIPYKSSSSEELLEYPLVSRRLLSVGTNRELDKPVKGLNWLVPAGLFCVSRTDDLRLGEAEELADDLRLPTGTEFF